MEVRHSIELAGGVRVLLDGQAIRLSLKKALGALVVLALSVGRPVGRDRLAALLWSDCDQQTARSSLRQTLHKLRRELGPSADDILVIGPEEVCLQAVEVDVTDALATARAGQVPVLLERAPNALLEVAVGLDGIDPCFANWLRVQRQQLHDDAVASLADALAARAPSDRVGLALARALLRLEPTHEAACRYLMSWHARTGNIAEALSHYAALWRLLEDEFDCLPSEETQQLVVAIKQGQEADSSASPADAPREPSARTSRTRQPPVLWIERFETTDLDEQTRLRASGLRRNLIAALCRFREWQVVDAAEGSPTFPEARQNIFVLSGSTVAHADSVDTVLNFCSLETGAVVWSERVDMSSGLCSRLERRVIRRIATALSLHLSANRLYRFRFAGDALQSAEDLWFLGQALLNDWRVESEDHAERLFRELIAEAPDFSLAHVGLAQVLNTRHLIHPGILCSQETHREALELSFRAVHLDPLDAKTQLTLAWSFALVGAWDSAIQAFGIAAELNDNDAWIVVSCALGLAFCGETATAGKMAAQIADFGVGITGRHWAYVASVAFLDGDYQLAIRGGELGASVNNYIDAWRVAGLVKAGRADEASTLLRGYFERIRSRWHGTDAPSDAAIMRWLLQCHPIRREDDWRGLKDALAAAGAPIEDAPPLIPA